MHRPWGHVCVRKHQYLRLQSLMGHVAEKWWKIESGLDGVVKLKGISHGFRWFRVPGNKWAETLMGGSLGLIEPSYKFSGTSEGLWWITTQNKYNLGKVHMLLPVSGTMSFRGWVGHLLLPNNNQSRFPIIFQVYCPFIRIFSRSLSIFSHFRPFLHVFRGKKTFPKIFSKKKLHFLNPHIFSDFWHIFNNFFWYF